MSPGGEAILGQFTQHERIRLQPHKRDTAETLKVAGEPLFWRNKKILQDFLAPKGKEKK